MYFYCFLHIISYEALDKHETECDYQSQQCPGCESQILKKDFDDHTRSCVSVKLICEDCRLVYKRGEANVKHTETICLKEQLRQVKEELKKNKFDSHAENMRLEEQLRQMKEELKKNKSEIQAVTLELRNLLVCSKRMTTFDFQSKKIFFYNFRSISRTRKNHIR